MVESMEVDAGAKAHENEAQPESEEAPPVVKVPSYVTLDKVSLLQASVDRMALGMFNALRLLPAGLESSGSQEETMQTIKDLAKDVLAAVKETDRLINDLPGLDKTESEQLEEMRRLQIQSEEEAQTLRQVADEAAKVRNMTEQVYGGRVLAGEDSEEDDDEEEFGFQLGGGFGATAGASTAAQPRFTVQTPAAAAPTNGESDEEDEDGDDEDSVVAQLVAGSIANDKAVTTAAPATASASSTPKPTPRTTSSGATWEDIDWTIDSAMDGVGVMSEALVRKLQPSLDATIRRISELTDNQERLLQQLAAQHREMGRNPKLEDIDVTMRKLPLYVRKVQDIKGAMSDITTSIEKMKKRAEYLRVEAQSHAIKKENKRESMTQWNKLYAAKSSEISGGNSNNSSSASAYAAAADRVARELEEKVEEKAHP
ncbi:TPA: hypothetical protein N0F65_007696 [Lagenidium giganteum]|uniref:Biogenesis of lysosome-related organelles complex 1 subunit 7 n=1 Tax=Lagenidium giganteum TaxID=4803 RepID=A0AAV2Z553_9STRA|nr:TPA: hypothetical protein N0F65_007696 [Lagenidium giganteum]